LLLKNLKLKNFRNYEYLDLSNIQSSRLVIVGDNAQGKTNLLEAIYFLAFASSYRASKELEVIKWNEEEAVIYAELFTALSTSKELNLVIRKGSNKKVKLDGQLQKRMASFVGQIKVVLFSSTDLELIRGVPSERRKFLDKLLVQVYPNYYRQLQVYNKIIQQKNHLLKQIRDLSSSDKQILEVWNEQLAEISTGIYEFRFNLIRDFSKLVSMYHSKIASINEKVSIKYNPSIPIDDILELDKETIKRKILSFINQNSYKEIARGQSLYGLHRDDISFFINDMDAKSFASQGQQRTLVLSLKLAEIKYIKDMTNETPILLLDDVMAELDKKRQQHLLEVVGLETQTFITTTHLEDFSENCLSESSLLYINSGKIV